MTKTDLELALLEAQVERLNAEVVQLSEQQRALEEARELYAALYDFVPAACFTLDSNGTIIEANRRAVSLLRYAHVHLLGLPLRTLVTREYRRSFLEHVLICKRAADAITFRIALAPNEGKAIPVKVTMRNRGERGDGYDVTMVDMRALEGVEAEQQRSLVAQQAAQIDNQVKTRLIANLSTELRGLLGAVLEAGTVTLVQNDLSVEFRAALVTLLDAVSVLQRRVTRMSSSRVRPRENGRRAVGLSGVKVRRLRAR